jgi:hypothetical protein
MRDTREEAGSTDNTPVGVALPAVASENRRLRAGERAGVQESRCDRGPFPAMTLVQRGVIQESRQVAWLPEVGAQGVGTWLQVDTCQTGQARKSPSGKNKRARVHRRRNVGVAAWPCLDQESSSGRRGTENCCP